MPKTTAGRRDAIDLGASADRIRSLHRTAVEAGLDIGRELIAVKAKLPHGGFTHWVKTELPFGVRQAQKYMRTAKNQVVTNPTHASHLPMSNEAMSLLTRLPNETLEQAIARGDVWPKMPRRVIITALVRRTRAAATSNPIAGPQAETEAERLERARAAALDWLESFGDIPGCQKIAVAFKEVFGDSSGAREDGMTEQLAVVRS